jgi:uncharacterized protein YcgI (DUF1989 family)
VSGAASRLAGSHVVHPERTPIAWSALVGVATLVVVALVAASGRYGYHRDELYFLRALAAKGVEIAPERQPDPINWFMNVGLKARGEFEIREPLSERGDQVLLKAHMDCLVVVSACPQDQNACNAFNPTDILVRVYA